MHSGSNREENKENPNPSGIEASSSKILLNPLSGKQEGTSANPFEKYGINIDIFSMLQIPPGRFAEITENLKVQSKDGPFSGKKEI